MYRPETYLESCRPMELRWIPNIDVSALHAAWVLASSRTLLDANLHERLAGPAAELGKLADNWHVPPSLFWRQLLGLALDLPNNGELIDRLYRRLSGGELGQAMASQAASGLAQCKAAFRQAYPRALDELQLRVGPLQSAWEARGPGLLAMIERATEAGFLVESAESCWSSRSWVATAWLIFTTIECIRRPC